MKSRLENNKGSTACTIYTRKNHSRKGGLRRWPELQGQKQGLAETSVVLVIKELIYRHIAFVDVQEVCYILFPVELTESHAAKPTFFLLALGNEILLPLLEALGPIFSSGGHERLRALY